ncbi:MAG: biotin-dependent carboxyltransferase [Halioglobus sp.]|nr:biotin-dependent carboxyltransferase [Halioglobus sp.]
MTVLQPGMLSLLQDSGRRGQHRLGLTTGGPLDSEAFHYCNRLLQNPAGSTAIEVSVGGLQILASTETSICVTGADMPLTINGENRPLWEVHPVSGGDIVRLGFARAGCRAYLGVAQGFDIAPCFGSTATVVRERIGGLRGEGLQAGDVLPCARVTGRKRLFLAARDRPRYQHTLTVRVIPGYQQQHFSRLAQRRFFGGTFRVSERSDRMGYRLEGPRVECDIEGILSEGICHGAIQVPPDGQPIVLLNDRQTIGGYPKIGTALSLDTARLSQLAPGSSVHFAAVTPRTAQRALALAQRFSLQRTLQERRP